MNFTFRRLKSADDGSFQGSAAEFSRRRLILYTQAAGQVAKPDGWVDYLNLSPNDPPTLADLQAVIDKVDELITLLRRQ